MITNMSSSPARDMPRGGTDCQLHTGLSWPGARGFAAQGLEQRCQTGVADGITVRAQLGAQGVPGQTPTVAMQPFPVRARRPVFHRGGLAAAV